MNSTFRLVPFSSRLSIIVRRTQVEADRGLDSAGGQGGPGRAQPSGNRVVRPGTVSRSKLTQNDVGRANGLHDCTRTALSFQMILVLTRQGAKSFWVRVTGVRAMRVQARGARVSGGGG